MDAGRHRVVWVKAQDVIFPAGHAGVGDGTVGFKNDSDYSNVAVERSDCRDPKTLAVFSVHGIVEFPSFVMQIRWVVMQIYLNEEGRSEVCNPTVQ